ncbi:glycosyltransferase [Frankia sp. AgB32]|uniref:glycosyltransferase n=1 Tax=Frankia sp. AgB32 TaxID=631119 RepID=UPI00200D611D|nr:glycosyltransferase [Frankia sp. AgB32]MCK9896583.1 glycosyltransferase [Frankia sp. AgB32]
MANSSQANEGSVLVDCAGARVGGAKRLLDEFDLYLRDRKHPRPRVIGRDRPLTASWLLRREFADDRRRERTLALALNNVSFVTVGRERSVLLHGAQQFLGWDEVRELGRRISPAVHAQVPVVWAAMRRADRVFVPSTSMAERVCRVAPALRDRVVVAFNPVTPPDPAVRRARADERRERGSRPAAVDILCPLIILPQKLVTRRLRAGLAALDILAAAPHRIDATLTVTGSTAQIEDPAVAHHPRLRLVGGGHPPSAVTELMARCDAIYFPSVLESFGYPLAEGRMMGVPVVALDSPHNREIAGPALVGYQRENGPEIAAALYGALTVDLKADQSGLFARGPYFDLLLGADAGR